MPVTSPQNVELFRIGQRACATCGVAQSLSSYWRARRVSESSPAGWVSDCKSCCSVKRSKKYATDGGRLKAQSRASALRIAYGISLEQFNQMFESQRGCCAICSTHQSELKKTLVVDHDHATQAIRGLLCDNCNVGIGRLGDDAASCLAAAAYLQKSARKAG